jgi:hypothetical protein
MHASMAGLFASSSGFTSLTSDRMIPRMFDFRSSIHIRRNVLGYLTSQGTLEDTLKDWLKKKKSFDEEYKSFSMKKPLKNEF